MAEMYQGGFEKILALQFDNSREKRKPEYGLKLSKSFWSNISTGYNSYYQIRNANWETNRKYSSGKITHEEFLSKLSIQGNKAYFNIDTTIAKILPKYQEALLHGWMDRDERPKVRATDILSSNFKEREKILAKYRMENREQIANMEKASGQKLEEGFTPESDDELDTHYKTKYRLPEEAFFEKTLKQIFNNNDYESFKRQILTDELNTGCLVSKIETINSHSKTLANRMKFRRCKPERTFYNIFESPIGADVSLIGEAYPITIAEARRQYPKVTEEQWFKIGLLAQKGLKQAEPLTWYNSYIYSYTRPYDDYSFMILDYEVKSIDKDYYVKTENQYGNTVVVPKKGKPNPQGNQEMKGEAIENERFNIYCGIWAIDTDIMLDWDIAQNMIRPYQNGVDVFFNYTIVIPNNDATYQPSLIERGISNVKAMALYKLKIAQMVSLMKADGVAIDVAGLEKVTIGQGETYSRMEIKRIYNQTGEVWWDSTDTTGTGFDGQKTPPITQLPNGGNVGQINSLIQLYNFELQNLNDEFGVNNDFLGAQVAAKRGARVSDNQIQAANKATEYQYIHFLWFMSMMATKIGYKLWDMIITDSSSYKEMSGMNSDMIDTTFDIDIEMSSKSEDKAKLKEAADIALNKQIVSLSQYMLIMSMDDLKEAQLVLERAEAKAAKAAAQAKQDDIKQNAQVQQQSLQMKAQADGYLEGEKAKREVAVEKAKGDAKGYEEMIALVRDTYVKSIETGQPVPESLKPLIEALTQNVINQSIVKPAQAEQAAQEAAQQEQQQQQAQQQQ